MDNELSFGMGIIYVALDEIGRWADLRAETTSTSRDHVDIIACGIFAT